MFHSEIQFLVHGMKQLLANGSLLFSNSNELDNTSQQIPDPNGNSELLTGVFFQLAAVEGRLEKLEQWAKDATEREEVSRKLLLTLLKKEGNEK